jgi:hypothetical protein
MAFLVNTIWLAYIKMELLSLDQWYILVGGSMESLFGLLNRHQYTIPLRFRYLLYGPLKLYRTPFSLPVETRSQRLVYRC